METKVVDSRGRIALGAALAGKTVIVKKTKMGWMIIPAVVIPEHEAWLMKNNTARERLEKGIADAAAGKFAEAPADWDDGSDDDEAECD